MSSLLKYKPSPDFPAILPIPESTEGLPDLEQLYIQAFTRAKIKSVYRQQNSKGGPDKAPIDWVIDRFIAEKIQRAKHLEKVELNTVREIAKNIVPAHNKICRIISGHYNEWFSPGCTQALKDTLMAIPTAPEGWLNEQKTAATLNISPSGVSVIGRLLAPKMPEAIKQVIDAQGELAYYISSDEEQIEALRKKIQTLQAPDNYSSSKSALEKLQRRNVHIEDAIKLIRLYLTQNPDSVKIFLDQGGDPREHISDELLAFLMKHLVIEFVPTLDTPGFICPEDLNSISADDKSDKARIGRWYRNVFRKAKAKSESGEQVKSTYVNGRPNKKIIPAHYVRDMFLLELMKRRGGSAKITIDTIRQVARLCMEEDTIMTDIVRAARIEGYPPGYTEVIVERMLALPQLPDNGVTLQDVAKRLHIQISTVEALCEQLATRDSEIKKIFLDDNGDINYYILTEDVLPVANLLDRLRPSKDYRLPKQFMEKFTRAKVAITDLVKAGRIYLAGHPGEVRLFLDSRGLPREHISTAMLDYFMNEFKIPKCNRGRKAGAKPKIGLVM